MDLNTTAFNIVKKLTEENKKDHEAARSAGKRGGAARAKALSETRRIEIARLANKARWDRSVQPGRDKS